MPCLKRKFVAAVLWGRQITFHGMRYQLLSALITDHEAEGEQRAAEAHMGASALATLNYALYAGELGCPPIRNAESTQVSWAGMLT